MIADRDARYGRVRVIDAGVADLATPACSEPAQIYRQILRWTPPNWLRRELGPEFAIDFQVVEDDDGARRFSPHGDLEPFINVAFYAGLRLQSSDGDFSREQVASYRTMKFIFDRVRGMREHLDRNFSYSRDLYLRPTSRQSDDDRNILPDHLGLDAVGRGRTWTLGVLCEKGNSRAKKAGVRRPTKRQKIAYGLLAAAERNPLSVDEAHVNTLVRTALFASPPDSHDMDAATLEEVLGRTADLLHAHRFDTNDNFSAWFEGPKSNLFKSIGGRKISTKQVRHAMLEIGWDAYDYVKICLSYFMRAFLYSLPMELSCYERQLIVHTYLPQSYLGGLPLVLLTERTPLLCPVVRRLWRCPGDPEAIGVLHRLLDYFSFMAPTRREADLLSSRRRGRLELTGLTAVEASSVSSPSSSTPAEQAQKIVELFIQQQNIRCDKCDRLMQGEAGLSDDSSDTHFPIQLWCRQHPKRQTIQVPLDELRRTAGDSI